MAGLKPQTKSEKQVTFSELVLRQSSNVHRPFSQLELKSVGNEFMAVAVPSRLVSRPGKASPFSGLRVAVKDNINLSGMKSSNGNRAFFELYPPQSRTAPCVQRLIDGGAFIVGKTKMNSWANWEEPIEYVDYQAPWNPRADGHQSPGGSSTGSACAIAAYDWLDITLGTDSELEISSFETLLTQITAWGSMSRPGLWCGSFSLRPSTDAVPRSDILPCDA